MKRICFLALIVPLTSMALFGQHLGDQSTAGYTSARTNLNSNFGAAVPPYVLASMIELNGTSNATSLLAFTDPTLIEDPSGTLVLLVGESTQVSTDYRLYSAASGALQWTSSFVNAAGLPLNYTPAVANDVVILGGPATSTVRAVRVSTGTTLWEDTSVGGTSGIDPIITNGLAIYGGSRSFRGVDPLVGPNPAFWTLATTTEAQAPISSFGIQAYIHGTQIGQAGQGGVVLYALESTTGTPLWAASGQLGIDDPNIIASEELVYINNDEGLISALDATDGSLVWSRLAGQLSTRNPTALAYDRLFVFSDAVIGSAGAVEGEAGIQALDPNNGSPLWNVTETGEGISYGTIANNVIYYYHEATQRVRARDAFNGALIWSLNREGVRGLSVVEESVILLFADRIEIYRPLQVLYFAHVADGGEQSTLLAVTNRGEQPVNATLNFFDREGNPLILEIDGAGLTSNLNFVVPAGASSRIQTLGGEEVQRGWARIVADGPLSGSSIFQARLDGRIAFEAGVSASVLRSQGNVYSEFLPEADPSLTLNTALALANPSDEQATVDLVLVDTDGSEIETAVRVLQPGEQIAEFISQFFPDQEFNNVLGSVRVRSDIPFVITALRTLGGLQLSSYAVGQ